MPLWGCLLGAQRHRPAIQVYMGWIEKRWLKVAATLPIVQHVMQDAPFPAVVLNVPLHVDARAANHWDEAH